MIQLANKIHYIHAITITMQFKGTYGWYSTVCGLYAVSAL